MCRVIKILKNLLEVAFLNDVPILFATPTFYYTETLVISKMVLLHYFSLANTFLITRWLRNIADKCRDVT